MLRSTAISDLIRPRVRRIDRCRVCGNTHLASVLDLGEQALTGVFPRTREQAVTAGPLRLVKCHGDAACGLVQLEHSYAFDQMYGDNYGYRSGLNASMVEHLHAKVAAIRARVALPAGSIVLDIGSNDGTTLAAYPRDLRRIGIDPTAAKFRAYYETGIEIVCELFTAASVRAVCGDARAAVVTSFAMFYDLDDPIAFMRDIHAVLADDGVWVFEQSYLPLMLERTAYDTVCHEHVEYYALAQVEWMTRVAGFEIVDVELNDINGGSFSITAAKVGSTHVVSARVAEARAHEASVGLAALDVYAAFAQRVTASRDALRSFVATARADGKTIGALGASTKGNVILQYAGFGPADLVAIGEVNAEKFGAFTPGSLIPIVPEAELIARELDYLLVLPWHFRDTFLRKRAQLRGKTRLVFPLPTLEIV